MPRFSLSSRLSPLPPPASLRLAVVAAPPFAWRLATLGAAGLLCGCSGWSGPAAPPQVAYDCDDGSSLVVQFSAAAAQVKTQIGDTYALVQQPSASGILYTGDGNTLRGKGDQAVWSTPGGAQKTCRALPSSGRSWWPW